MTTTITSTSFSDLPLLNRGKVRDLYAVPGHDDQLLMVVTDRISAFDVVLHAGIPGKGQLLTSLSLEWFRLTEHIIPNHLITADVDSMPESIKKHADVLRGRAILVKKAQVVPIEAIVRGYLSGSAWKEYKVKGSIHGIELPKGLVKSDKLPQVLFTPSTKAEIGQHDMNIHPDEAAKLIGAELCALISDKAVEIYNYASKHASQRGLILADTKFEFGLLPETRSAQPLKERLILVDEVLTPDSSRFWEAKLYQPGQAQTSFDKQYLRDFLLQREKEGIPYETPVPENVIEGIRAKYAEALQRLTGPPTEA
ncbi:phosphoribosylamidoimidazole-succinocarboxamide synthase [Dacryopinax primogenitus]|uniref:Phosphoribosylaminoimidazole-succinocarboxamide synthase n=1 Tax=Dacryopinax primogenitus (strain DJM 731) TaxID=1858805 RepID=M5GFH5_DACPD|nr:phosphoribosylamidoimidazole-succinocarboxamide synthase [Dacryopinax primogenitus]EJU06297.1 phosphoribosylamidoimidazole-succinocarboxamide synthase [Dacryopinax primogenitus]